jgi:SAM-dependent methyltransferase
MADSTSWRIAHPLRFAKSFLGSTKRASYALAKRLYRSLPPFAQRPVKVVFEWTAPLRSGALFSVFRGRRDLVADIANRFHVPESFVRLYREQGHVPTDWSGSTWQEFFENLPPLQKMTVPFAMSTVMRGRGMLSLLESQSCLRKKNRYLDVGTGYGGFLRAAKEMGFKEVIGIELQPFLADLAKANIDGLQGAQVLLGDFVKDDFSTLGSLDLITCNDVIEHVDDPALTIQKMSTLLTEDGCLCFEVPNKDCITFVKEDGHFLIFGITQLAKNDAAAYHSASTGADKSVYMFEMGELYELDWYFKKLAENGLSAFIADTHSIGGIEDVPKLMADLRQAYKKWQTETKPKLKAVLSEQITASIEKYLKDLQHDLASLSDDASKVRFKNRYLRAFWTLTATKRPAQ